MNNFKKIPIDDILYQLSMILPEEDFNEDYLLELAMSAYRQIGHEVSLDLGHTKIEIKDHTGILNITNYYKIKQGFIKPFEDTAYNLDEVKVTDKNDTPVEIQPPVSLWTNMTSPISYLSSEINNKYSVMYYDNNLTIESEICDDISTCIPSFKIVKKNINGADKFVVYTNVKEGIMLLSYIYFDTMIEDDEDLKQGLIKYIIANIYLSKAIMNNDDKKLQLAKELEREAETYLGKVKGKLNLPSEEVLEKLRLDQIGMIPEDKYKTGFRFNPHRFKYIL